MSWEDFYRRREALEAVLHRARHDPHGDLPFAEVPAARAAFAEREELLLALQHRWTQVLTGYLNVVLDDLDAAAAHGTDDADAVEVAWRKATRAQPVLRAVLDAQRVSPHTVSPRLRKAYDAERRILAAADLAPRGDRVRQRTLAATA